MNIEKIVKEQRKYFNEFNTRDINSRINTLKTIQKWILNNEDKIYEALEKDLNKSTVETYMCEIGMALSDIRYQINHLKKWSKRKMVLTSLAQFPSIGYKYYEPYGVTLVMSTWNYPFLLSVQPTIASIAAGNTVILKPSVYAPNTSSLLNKMFTETCNKNLVTVVEGGRCENEEILNQKYDYIFFTGSSNVGKIVMSKASEHLTPVTLELGGKSPCIIDDDDNFKTCVKRCIFGKLLNSGQTCIATDYLFIREDLKERFIEEARIIIEDFFGDNPLASDQMVKIVNKKHFDRLNGLLKDEKILLGGKIDLKAFKIEPTLVEIKSKEVGFFEFLGCLNTILIKYIGADATWLPQWKCDMRLVERVFTEILYPSSLPANLSLWDKTCKFFASNWKFKLVYCHENILMASLRQARAYRRVKWNKDGMSIWEKNKQ